MPGDDDQGQATLQVLCCLDDSDFDEEDVFDAAPAKSLRSPADKKSSFPQWDWNVEYVDRAREAKHDGTDRSFQVDRRIMRDIVREQMGVDVARIRFISSGTFHKAYFVTLATGEVLVMRIARRFMPRLKTESEVATIAYLRETTQIPVPIVYAWDSNPYNRIGGEWMLMSKARGIPLRRVYHSMALEHLIKFLHNLAELLMPLFAHRFSHIGSLYTGEGSFSSEVEFQSHADANASSSSLYSPSPQRIFDHASSSSLPTPVRATSSAATPKLNKPCCSVQSSSSIISHHISHSDCVSQQTLRACRPSSSSKFHVGPIVSWPFFGSHRGELSHASFPPEIERGPWATSFEYYRACANREILGVARENEGRAKPHRLHLDPDDFVPRGQKGKKGEYIWGYGFVRHPRMMAYEDNDRVDVNETSRGSNTPSDDRDDSEESSTSGSPALSINSDVDEDTLYRDYRRYQRSTFLVAELAKRERRVRNEMDRWRKTMASLESVLIEVTETARNMGNWTDTIVDRENGKEMFGLDCHDISLDNVFVDKDDPTRITCIIDWESTTTRPLWQCAHLPSFLLSSPFCANLFRKAVASLSPEKFPIAAQWLLLERTGAPLRYAHKCVEWDGWEEGLVGSILGNFETESDTPHSHYTFPGVGAFALAQQSEKKEFWQEEGWEEPLVTQMRLSLSLHSNHRSARDGVEDGDSVCTGVHSTDCAHACSMAVGGPVAIPFSGAGDLSPSAMQGLRRLRRGSAGSAPFAKERVLDGRGDICGGRGGELGRRLEAWLIENPPERGAKDLQRMDKDTHD